MRRFFLTTVSVCCIISLFAQEKIYIHQSDKSTLGTPVSLTDSIYFSDDATQVFFRVGDTTAQFNMAEIDSITFDENSFSVGIEFTETGLVINNPLAFEGVTVTPEGSDIIIHATGEIQDVEYHLSGTTPDGMFKIYSEKRFYVFLENVNITNADGPAINIQSSKNGYIVLAEGTTNTLTDGVTYAEPPNGEDQDAAFFSEGDLIFSGSGTLSIHGNGTGKHGLCSDDEIEIQDGIINITGANLDAVHSNDGVRITGGQITLTSASDGIDAESGYIEIAGGNITINNSSDNIQGLVADSIVNIAGGVIDITVSGDQSKGMQSDSLIVLSGGEITIHNSGDAVLIPTGSGNDPSYCTAIRSSGRVEINGAETTIVASGKAGRGISADTEILINGGNLHITSTGNGATYTNTAGQTDAYVAACLSSDGVINIHGGTVVTSSSGTGGKGVTANGGFNMGLSETEPSVQITTTGARIYISGSGNNAKYAEAKAMKSDDDILINKGTLLISSADDGIKSESSVTINEATVTISNSEEGIEAPFITINGGNTHVYADDDAINATFGNGGEQNDGSMFKVTAGYLMVSTTGGDGLDSNGNIQINGGTIVVHGPPNSPEVGMDYNGTCEMNAGFLVISGTNSNMTQAPGNSSDQYCLKIRSNQMLSSTTLFHIQNAAGDDVVTFQPLRNYYSIIFSSSALQSGASYSIYTGGTCTGTKVDGLYTGGTYSGGTFRKTFTVTGIITSVNF